MKKWAIEKAVMGNILITEGWSTVCKDVRNLKDARSIVEAHNTQKQTKVAFPFPAKWTRFKNEAGERARFQVDDLYLIRFRGPLGDGKQAEGFVRKDDTIKGGLPILAEQGEIAIPFHAIKQVKRVD